MLAFLGLAMVVVFTYLIMSKRLSPIVALTLVPVLFALIGGFGGTTGKMMLDGLKMVAPSAALLLFAILFFGLMIDAGLFDPLIRKILKRVNGDPMKIAVGTALLSLTVALDGDGTTTYMITCAAMLPLYKRIGMNPMILGIISMLSLSIMSGMTPWGGPATRAIAALGLDAGEYFASACQDERLFYKWHEFDVRVLPAHHVDAEIRFAPQYCFQTFVGAQVEQADADLGITLVVQPDHAGQEIERGGRDAGEGDLTNLTLGQFTDVENRILEVIEQPARLGKEIASHARQTDPSRGAIQQRRAQALFELLDAPRERRL